MIMAYMYFERKDYVQRNLHLTVFHYWKVLKYSNPGTQVGTKNKTHFPFNPKFRKFRLVHQMERTISVWSDQNIRDQLWRWSTFTGLVISIGRTGMPLFICQNCCPQYRSFVSCLKRTMESEVRQVKHDTSNSLNQLQFFSILDICH